MSSSWLSHPLARGLGVDDRATTLRRREIISEKKFLNRLYREWYRFLVHNLPAVPGRVLELGSGAGFFREFVSDAITSDVFLTPGIDAVIDGQHLPFSADSLRAIVLVDVLHHIREPRLFLAEAARCLKPSGAVIMIEPWVTPWSTLIYQNFHHELFDPAATSWTLPQGGPLSTANGAMAWVIFKRDRELFDRLFPALNLKSVLPDMPVSYLLSGGVSMRSLMPGWSYGFWRGLESLSPSVRSGLAMFAGIVLEKR